MSKIVLVMSDDYESEVLRAFVVTDHAYATIQRFIAERKAERDVLRQQWIDAPPIGYSKGFGVSAAPGSRKRALEFTLARFDRQSLHVTQGYINALTQAPTHLQDVNWLELHEPHSLPELGPEVEVPGKHVKPRTPQEVLDLLKRKAAFRKRQQ